MSEIFTNILTKIGQQKKALAEANNTPLNITTFKVGDSNGAYYEPNENQTNLVNAKYTGTFVAGTQCQIVVNPAASNEVLYKCFIPANVGGFTIRELGLFDSSGNLILICKLPAQDKFSVDSGLYQPLTFTPKIVFTNPQTQAVLTPTSQVVPTTSQITDMINQNLVNLPCTLPIKNTSGALSLQYDTTLKLLNNKLSVELGNIIKTDGSNKATSLLGYAATVSATADLDIPSYKNIKDYITAQYFLKKDGSVTATSLLSYASSVTAAADLNIPSYKNVKDYIAGLNYLKKDGTDKPTALLSYYTTVSASADTDIPSYKNVKDYITAQYFLRKDGTITPAALLTYAAAVTASGDQDIPSYKNVKDYIAAQYFLRKDGTITPAALLTYAAAVAASGDQDIPSYKNVKDYIAAQNFLRKDATVTPASLLTYAAAVTASGDQDIPSYKNVKDYITAQNILKKDGTVAATAILSYASAVTASSDLNIPSYKNVKDYFNANLPTLLPRFAINSAQIGTDGQPNYLTGVGTTTLTLNTTGSYANVVATFANGIQKILSANLTYAFASQTGTYFIMLTNSSTPALTIDIASYLYIKPTAPALTTNYRWLDTSVRPSVFKSYSGSAWVTETADPTVARIPLGLVTVSSGSITSITHFPLNHNFVDVFNNDSISLGTLASGSVNLMPNMKYSLIASGALTLNIPEVPQGQEINIQLDMKVSSASLSFTWSKTINWIFDSVPPLNDTTQTYEILLTYKPLTATWEGRWSAKTL